MSDSSPAETTMQNVYTLRGIMYLPHYQQPGKFVAPGHDKYSKQLAAHQLRAAGAELTVYPLWPRAS